MFKIIVAYDGTDFNGWQIQPNEPSITQTLQDSFAKRFDHKIKIVGASRTDAGVHAIGQVATFRTDLVMDPQKMISAWNDILPPTVVIRDIDQVADDFHPIYGVAQKTYWYHFFLDRPLPFVERYGWFFRYPLDMKKLEQSLQLFVGTYDFRSFCTGTDMGENTVRTIESIELVYKKEFGAWRIVVKGPGFMRHMIRRIVGACMQVASKDDVGIDYLNQVLAQKDPRQTLVNAPAKGLCLYKIIYKN
jgi:tRNA pseudouridine38-40 synthase